MNVQDVNLSALISTRICHDLINPIGAISNGLELMGTMGSGPGPEFDLVNDSAALANAKLNMFRVAFGDVSLSSEIKTSQVAKMIQSMYQGSRFKVSLEVEQAGLPRGEVKLALLLLFCIESSLPLGGDCKVTRSNGTWVLAATAPRVKPNIDLWDVARRTKSGVGISASDVHFLVAELTATQIGTAVNMQNDEERLAVAFSA